MAHPKNSDFIDQLNAELNAESQGDEADEANSATSKADESAGSSTGKKKKSNDEDFAALLGESLKTMSRKLSVGDKIRGKILVLGKEDVFVSTGTQHDGLIHRRDLLDKDGNCPFKVDDVIDLYVTQVRGSDIRLSRKATDKNLAEDLEDAFDMMLPISGRIAEVCKGGVRVNIKGKLAFCPISQIDVRHVENPEEYVGKSFEFRITQFSEGGRNIVVSRRKLLEEERELNAESFLEEHQDGEIVQGKVARLEKFGAFIELAPGIDGLVHISEIAWYRIGDPAEVLQVGQEVTVKILKRETINGRMRLSLSIKQTIERDSQEAGAAHGAGDPSQDGAQSGASGQPGLPGAPGLKDTWAKYTVGQIISGKVNRKEVYGLFVQLEPGITGLLHKSKAVEHPEFHFEKLRVGDAITVQIGEIRKDERRISLDVPRDPHEDDWRTQPQQAQTSFGTLGDQFKAALEKKKKA